MGIHTTKYETKNGKTRKVKETKNNAPDSKPGSGQKPQTGDPVK